MISLQKSQPQKRFEVKKQMENNQNREALAEQQKKLQKQMEDLQKQMNNM
jgi:hypothetical protein